jgi:ATP synthase F1 epsilon subunit
MSLQVCILTPSCIFRNEVIEELVLQTSTGQIGILRNHAPLITTLDIGPIIFRGQKNWEAIVLIGGFALVQENKVTILVNEAELGSSIVQKEAEQLLVEATNRLNTVVGEKEKVEAVFSFKRARARFQVSKWKSV